MTATNVDGFFLTREQMKALQAELKRIPGLVTELDNAITRQTAFGDFTDARPQDPDEAPVEFNDHASDIAVELHGAVRNAVLAVCTQQKLPWPGEHRAGPYAVWLREHIIDVTLTETADRLDRDIHAAVKRARAAIDRPAPLEFAGPCQSDLPGVQCDGVYVRPGTDAVKCLGCGVACDVRQMQTQMRAELATVLYRPAELAAAMSIYLGTEVGFERIRNWIRRGKLIPAAGRDEDKTSKYRLNEAIELWNRRPTRKTA